RRNLPIRRQRRFIEAGGRVAIKRRFDRTLDAPFRNSWESNAREGPRGPSSFLEGQFNENQNPAGRIRTYARSGRVARPGARRRRGESGRHQGRSDRLSKRQGATGMLAVAGSRGISARRLSYTTSRLGKDSG